jgi:chemotaxis-related protein WspD
MSEARPDIRNTCFKQIGISGDSTCPKLQEFTHCRICPEFLRTGKSLFERPMPEEWREEWTGSLAEAKETEAPGAFVTVVFRIGGEWLALGASCILRIMNPRPIHTIPFRTGKVFLGLANVDGELIPCVSLPCLMGLSESEAVTEAGVYRRMIMVAQNGERFAFTADEVLEVRRMSPEEVRETPSTVSRSGETMSSGVFLIGEKTVGLLDENKFFTSLRGSLRF